MSKNDFDDVDFDVETNGVKRLRKLYEETAKTNKQLQARLEKFEASNARSNVGQLLKDRGLDSRVAKFYPQDRDTTADAVDEWVAENRELFGAVEVSKVPDLNATTLTSQQMHGYEIIRAIDDYERATEMDLKSRLDAAENEGDVMRILQEFEAAHVF